ncbi:hypothetical protein ACTHGU_00245 [Chitinophagaceae bacterium MMS25-I14]
MSFLRNIFRGRDTPPEYIGGRAVKSDAAIYPMIKDSKWPYAAHVKCMPFVQQGNRHELVIVFARDAGSRFEYITADDLEQPEINKDFQKWQEHIDQYPFEIEVSETLGGRVIMASGKDFSAEKILSSAFLAHAGKILNTDKLIISVPRRRCLMITGFYESFNLLESFFYLHFTAWRDDTYGNEPITEMVFIAEKNALKYAVPLGFRIEVYEDKRKGERMLTYSTMDELLDEDQRINFQMIMERNKIPVVLP